MHITRVRIRGLTNDAVKERHSAIVLLETEGGQVTLQSSVATVAGFTDVALAEALLSDAIRQLSRLPECRTGATSITVATGAFDGALQKT